ncbi:DUF1194 domain-containing protein [Oricola cellulosilytica]|uniref:DUF1194 domain-containing protein n=2 Tax=Oricola cellulosilytica TaxID=1429082 RepID=A0A4R0PDW7_9HYPH|nr:DUF1194 domain-containing protein [Oricola cellulosilytica]
MWRAAFVFLLSAVGSASAQERVDAELVIAVDVSDSMGLAELRHQRRGYVAAFRSPEVVSAIREGRLGRVAVTYVEWARDDRKRVIVPWTIVEDEETAGAVATQLEIARVRNMRRTSISGAIRFGIEALASNRIEADRQVIDISGDGPNNQGEPVSSARDLAVARGITINGLPLLVQPWYPGLRLGAPGLDLYYEQCVIGGPNSFMVPVRSWEEFPAAVRHKLVIELAGRPPEDVVVRADLKIGPDVDCLIGERARRDFESRYPG